MFQQLLLFVPTQVGPLTLAIALAATVAGAVMWLAGARFSRGAITLMAVALGTIIGKNLPAWCGWSIDPMGPAVGGALILGVSAFALHRLWVGLWLGTVLACWAALTTWVIAGHGAAWAWPANHGLDLPHYLAMVWHTLPVDVVRYLPLSTGVAFCAGAAAGILWPRIGLFSMWSAAGASMLLITIVLILQRINPAIVRRLPKQGWLQAAILLALVLAGAMWQWKSTPVTEQGDEPSADAPPDKKPAKSRKS